MSSRTLVQRMVYSPPTLARQVHASDDVWNEDEPPRGLEARAHAWLVTGDPARLWPALDPALLPQAAIGIERSVVALLDGGTSSLGAADGHDADAIGIAAHLSGTGPLLGYWMERGALDVSERLARILARHLAHGRRRLTRMTREVMPALSSLVDGGANPAIIKGFHTAHVYFPEPGLRPIADVDVVVAANEVARAEDALRSVDFTPDPALLNPYKREWYPPALDRRLWSVEYWHARGEWKLDLHDAINFSLLMRYGIRLDAVAPITGRWDGLEVPLRVPTHPLLFAILSTHFSGELYNMRLLRLIELTLVIRRDHAAGTLDWAAVDDLFHRARALRFAYPALALVERLAPGTVDARLLVRARKASTRLSRIVVDQFTPASPILQDRVFLAERMMWASNPIDAMRRIALMAVPVGSGTPTILRAYYGRVRRLLTGRVSWRMQRDIPREDRPAP